MIGATSKAYRNTYKSSDLSRSSSNVFSAASDHPVTVTRRDGEPLVLMSEREDQERNKLLQLAAQLIGAATLRDGNLTKFMTEHFPWMLALSPEDQDECARDVLDAARASFSTGQSHMAVSTLISWQETAEAIAMGLGQTPVDWITDEEPIERP